MSKPSAKRPAFQRPSFWGFATAGVVLLAAAAIATLNAVVYNAESVVKEYVAALQAGAGDTAMAVSNAYLADDAPENISTVLLDGEALAASAAVLLDDTEIVAVDSEVPESFRDEEVTQRVVEIRYRDAEDNTEATSVVVDKVSTSWLFFDRWEMHPTPLQQVELAPSRMPANSKADEPVARIYEQATPLLGEDSEPAVVAAFAPSIIELEYHATYLEAGEPQYHVVTDVLAAGATAEFGFQVQLTSAVDEAINQEVQQQLERCTSQTVLKPAGCPFGYETTNRVVPETVSWSIGMPEVQYSWHASEPAIDRILATAELSAQEVDIGSGQQAATDYEEVFEMSADLELTPENLRVSPDWQ